MLLCSLPLAFGHPPPPVSHLSPLGALEPSLGRDTNSRFLTIPPDEVMPGEFELFPVSSRPCLVSVANRFNPGGSDSNESICNAGDQGLIPGSGRSPGEGNGNPLQHYCLEFREQRSLAGIVHGVAKSRTRLSN